MSITNITPLELYMVVKDADLIRRLMATHQPVPITARQMAKDMGWKSHTYMNRILTGEVRTVKPDAAVKIAWLLGVPVDVIFMTRASGNAVQSVRQSA